MHLNGFRDFCEMQSPPLRDQDRQKIADHIRDRVRYVVKRRRADTSRLLKSGWLTNPINLSLSGGGVWVGYFGPDAWRQHLQSRAGLERGQDGGEPAGEGPAKLYVLALPGKWGHTHEDWPSSHPDLYRCFGSAIREASDGSHNVKLYFCLSPHTGPDEIAAVEDDIVGDLMGTLDHEVRHFQSGTVTQRDLTGGVPYHLRDEEFDANFGALLHHRHRLFSATGTPPSYEEITGSHPLGKKYRDGEAEERMRERFRKEGWRV